MQKQNIFLHNLGQIITFIKILELHVLLNNIKATLTVVTHTQKICFHRQKFSSSKFQCVFCVCICWCELDVGIPECVEIMLINCC